MEPNDDSMQIKLQHLIALHITFGKPGLLKLWVYTVAEYCLSRLPPVWQGESLQDLWERGKRGAQGSLKWGTPKIYWELIFFNFTQTHCLHGILGYNYRDSKAAPVVSHIQYTGPRNAWLLHTASDLGANWPAAVALWLVELLPMNKRIGTQGQNCGTTVAAGGGLGEHKTLCILVWVSMHWCWLSAMIFL